MKSPRPHLLQNMDLRLLVAVLSLTAIGLMMVLSASSIMAERQYGDSYLFFRRQVFAAGLGLALMGIMAFAPLKLLIRLKYLWLLLALALLGATLTPLGEKINGARRWLNLGGFGFQPLEFAKLALMIYLAWFFSEKQPHIRRLSVGMVPFAVTLAMGAILVSQPDLGGAVFLVTLLLFMSLVGGTRLRYLGASVLTAAATFWLLVLQEPYRLRRWLSFLDPFEDARGAGYQVVQSLYAFGAGGWAGAGLGAGKQKLFFLPEAHNDFILAVLGEELGFFGVSIVFLLMGLLLWRAFAISLAGRDLQERLVGYGAALILCIGAVLNAAVVLSVAPPKGVPMPFISYGGSSLLVCFMAAGLLLNLSRRHGAGGGN